MTRGVGRSGSPGNERRTKLNRWIYERAHRFPVSRVSPVFRASRPTSSLRNSSPNFRTILKMPIERVLIEINKREMEDKKKSKNTVTCIEQQDEK